jgi:hypothetical protein
MARYNTSQTATTSSGATTISAPAQGYIQTLTGTAPFTVAIPDPRLYPGIEQVYYNNTTGTGIVTLSTVSGSFVGSGSSGTSTQTFPTGTTITLVSDGANYIITNEDGGPLVATTGTFGGTLTANGILSATSTVNLNPASANVTISPTGSGIVTIGPATAGSITNMSIGSSNPSSGAFTSLAANGILNLSSTSATHTISSTTASSSYTTGALTISGGLGVTGSINCNGSVVATGLSGPLTGTIQTASQPNITTLGGLTSIGTTVAVTGNVNPQATNSYDLGTTSLRWRNIYTQDLHLSNGIGDYTLIEGVEDLFIVNNKTGKSFKFALIEVDPAIIPPKSATGK